MSLEYFDFGLSAAWQRPPRLGVYVHVPFCPHICPYCDFLKTDKFNAKQLGAFLTSIRRQWELLRDMLASMPANLETTLYFGGGTPSLLAPEAIAEVIELVRGTFSPTEITLESNPFTNRPRALAALRQAGVTRLTLGAQSLCPVTLAALGRKHSPRMVLESLEAARAAGFSEIQTDLIYGLKPTVRSLELEEEIRTLVQHGATGISTYSLTLESGTAFADSDLSDEDEAVREYAEIFASCVHEHGMKRWETSNFSWSEPRHNQTYWMGFPYLALGAGAHGLLPGTPDAPHGTRFRAGPETTRKRSPGNSILDFEGDESLAQLNFEASRTAAEARLEFLYTAPRTAAGLPRAWLRSNCDESVFLASPNIAAALVQGKLILTESSLCLADDQRLFSDRWTLVLSEAFDSHASTS